jgi:hypothetical protein
MTVLLFFIFQPLRMTLVSTLGMPLRKKCQPGSRPKMIGNFIYKLKPSAFPRRGTIPAQFLDHGAVIGKQLQRGMGGSRR